MRAFFWCQLGILLLAATGASAQVDAPSPSAASSTRTPDSGTSPPAGTTAPTTTATDTPGITVSAPRSEQALPELKPDHLENCADMYSSTSPSMSPTGPDFAALAICSNQFAREKRIVVEACVNPKGEAQPRRVIQACSELLEGNIFEKYLRYAVYVNRAHAYIAQGDQQHALDDYAEAVKGSPHNANIYYDRGLFYATQSNYAAAMSDFNMALSLDEKMVAALRQRAKVYQAQGNLGGALADYSQAIRLKPKTAPLWSERGYLSLRQHDNESALKDETEAIRLDEKLAVAYFYRGAAYGGLGQSANAVTDLTTAVNLDPSLDRYVTSQGKSASIALPPIPP